MTPAERLARDNEALQRRLFDALREVAKLAATVEVLTEENRVLRLANRSLARPWASREGERE
jgi:regulator of replication initiation timing